MEVEAPYKEENKVPVPQPGFGQFVASVPGNKDSGALPRATPENGFMCLLIALLFTKFVQQTKSGNNEITGNLRDADNFTISTTETQSQVWRLS